jgi:hypothetical protein
MIEQTLEMRRSEEKIKLKEKWESKLFDLQVNLFGLLTKILSFVSIKTTSIRTNLHNF